MTAVDRSLELTGHLGLHWLSLDRGREIFDLDVRVFQEEHITGLPEPSCERDTP